MQYPKVNYWTLEISYLSIVLVVQAIQDAKSRDTVLIKKYEYSSCTGMGRRTGKLTNIVFLLVIPHRYHLILLIVFTTTKVTTKLKEFSVKTTITRKL